MPLDQTFLRYGCGVDAPDRQAVSGAPAAPRASGLPVSSQRTRHRAVQSCLDRGSDLPPCPREVLLLRGGHKLGHPRVLAWSLSNTLDARFCTDALSDALQRYGHPGLRSGITSVGRRHKHANSSTTSVATGEDGGPVTIYRHRR